jgi:DNA-binding transcriptional regulator YhcF (GntR family)
MQNATFLIDIAKALDRSLPVPLSVQLKGLIEYGIACGELAEGTRLPSVRELAGAGGIAAMTVSSVYKELQSAGLVLSRPGSGNFVATGNRADTELLQEIQAHLDAALAAAEGAGIPPSDVAGMLNARIGRERTRDHRALRLTMIGIFQEATQAYADEILRLLKADERIGPVAIEAMTFTALQESLTATINAVGEDAKKASLPATDLYVTFVNRKSQVEALVGHLAPVVALSFIPSEQTRAKLAAIDPLARVGLVSVFPEFLALFKPGVLRFAPHVQAVEATVVDDPTLDGFLSAIDVVVYATGAEQAVARRPAGVPAIEYRHAPDPHSVRQLLLPALKRLPASGVMPAQTQPDASEASPHTAS